jgi:2-methylcitrate dehydratase PrpD
MIRATEANLAKVTDRMIVIPGHGEEFMLSLAVSYEIQCRFTAAVPVMAKGFNHATQLAMSVAAADGKLFGLSQGDIANAIAVATADSVSLACIHLEPVSQWKGFPRAGRGCGLCTPRRWPSADLRGRGVCLKGPWDWTRCSARFR